MPHQCAVLVPGTALSGARRLHSIPDRPHGNGGSGDPGPRGSRPCSAPAARPSPAHVLADLAPSNALPTWEQFLDQAPHTGSQDVVSLLDGLAAVPEASASHVAGAILIIIKDLHVPNRAHQLLNLATTTALLVQAAKNAWLQCPEPYKHRLRPELERLCATVSSKFGSTLNTGAKNAALQAIQPHITANAHRPGVTWTSVALQVAATPAFPITAYTAVQGVVDVATFRQGIHQLCQPTCLCTAAEYKLLQEGVKQLLPLTAEDANFDWFLAGLSAPPPGQATVLAPVGSALSTMGAPIPAALPVTAQPSTTSLLPAPATPSQPAPQAHTATVRVTGLQTGNQEAMTATLTLTLGTPMYVAAQDSRRGRGIAVVPSAVHSSLFAAHHKRLLRHLDGWELTLTSRNEVTGEPWRVGTSSLTDPPSQRPDASTQPGKRVRVASPSSPHRRSPRLHEQARHVHVGTRQGRAVRGAMWPGHRERR